MDDWQELKIQEFDWKDVFTFAEVDDETRSFYHHFSGDIRFELHRQYLDYKYILIMDGIRTSSDYFDYIACLDESGKYEPDLSLREHKRQLSRLFFIAKYRYEKRFNANL